MFDGVDLLEMALSYDGEGRILSGNPGALAELGFGDDLAGLGLEEIFIGEEDFRAHILGLAAPSDIDGLVAYRKNGTCFPVFVRAIPEKNLILALNISNESQLEKEVSTLRTEAEGLKKSRNEFVANVTHELRTPVNGIRGHVAAMMADCGDPETRKTYEIILKCCEDMTFHIGNILDFSKLEAGKFELSEVVFDLHELFDHIVATNIANINEKGLRIILNVAADVPREVYGDDIRIRQILNNLVSNAIKFTDVGFVGIDVSKQNLHGDEIELFVRVSDTGIGVSPDNMDKLFKSFSQADASSTRKYGGTGLGLMITKELVELMSGTIAVESVEGKGSNFTFTIHLKVGEHLAAAKSEKAKHELPHFHKKDDKAQFESILKGVHFDIRSADSLYQFGTAENVRESRRITEILILALELSAWDKAEKNLEHLKRLTEGGPDDLKKKVTHLGMAIRKEDREKSFRCHELVVERLGY